MILSGKLVFGVAAVAALAFVTGWLTRGVLTSKSEPVGPAGLAAELKSPAPVADARPSEVSAPVVERILLDAPPAPLPDPYPIVSGEPTMEEALATLDRAIRARPIHDDFDRAFEAKYANASVEALKEARELVRTQMLAAQDAITKERMAMGMYETNVGVPGDGTPRLTGQKGRRGATIFTGSQEPSADGSMISKTVEIHPEDYPEFDAVFREYTWLRRKLNPPASASVK